MPTTFVDYLDIPVVDLRSDLPIAQLLDEVTTYVCAHPGAAPSEIAFALDISFDDADRAVAELADRGVLRPGL